MKTHYEILGLSSDASFVDIRKAFTKKAKILHPDKNPIHDTTEEMKSIINAYQVLSDPEQREKYDRENTGDTAFDDIYENAFDNPAHFFSTKKKVLTIGEWRVEDTFHIFIYHPKIKGVKDNITIWYFSNAFSISLPINGKEDLYKSLCKSLIPIIPEYNYWSCNNISEITIKLPTNQTKKLAILTTVCNAYQLPHDLMNYIKNKMQLPSEYISPSNKEVLI